jgi:hypothetical protein
VACTTANIVQWYLAAGLVVASLAAYAQTPEHAKTRPVPSDTDQVVDSAYQPIAGRERWKWFLESTIGPQSLAAGVFSAGFGTARNSPNEYGGTWEGFGKRYGMRLTGVSTGNALEAAIGVLWREDPRYFRAPGRSFGRRVQNIVKMTFVARRQNGNFVPAYARYVGTAGNNVLSSTWRVDSEADARHAAVRTLLGFAGRMGSNAFQEFWPDVTRRILKKKP